MRTTTPAAFSAVALVSLIVAPIASAQTTPNARTPVQSFASLQPLLKPGQSVIVTDRKGLQTTGKVVSIAGSQIELRINKTQLIFEEDAVRRVQRNDSTWDGLVVGFAVGSLLAWAEVAHCDSPSHTPGTCEATVAYLYPLALGWAGEKIDGALHKSLYMSPQKKTVTVSPLIGGDRIGIAATIRFNRGRQ